MKTISLLANQEHGRTVYHQSQNGDLKLSHCRRWCHHGMTHSANSAHKIFLSTVANHGVAHATATANELGGSARPLPNVHTLLHGQTEGSSP